MFRIIYNAVYLCLLFPAAIVFFIINPRRALHELRKSFFHRMGFYPKQSSPKPTLVIRCASLGEVRVAARIVDALSAYHVVISVGTTSAFEYATKNKIGDSCVFTPPDFFFFTKNFFRRMKAKNLILIESELWPELLWSAKDAGMGVFLVNGRFSPKSVSVGKKLKGLIGQVLKNVDYFCVRYDSDKDALNLVGVPDGKIRVTGNIKYVFDGRVKSGFRRDLGFGENDIIITAGSTHKADELALAKAFGILRDKYKNVKMIVVPRHVERASDTLKLFGDSAVLYAAPGNDAGASEKRCFVVGEIGVLEKFYSICDIAVVGGSFGRRGGQDPIEPAFFSKPVVFGPQMKNFAAESGALLSVGGAFSVSDATELSEKLDLLINDAALRNSMGENARKVVGSSAKKDTMAILHGMLRC